MSDICQTRFMIHKHVTMRDFLRSPEKSLPQQPGDATFIHRNSSAGPQIFALSAANLAVPDITTSSIPDEILNSALDKIYQSNKHNHGKK